MKTPIEIQKLEIPEKDIKPIDFEAFNELQGEIYKFKDIFLTKSKNQWFSTQIPKKELQTTKEENRELQTTQSLSNTIEWCKKFQKYINSELIKIRGEIKEIKSENVLLQNNLTDGFETMKNYIDKKTEVKNAPKKN